MSRGIEEELEYYNLEGGERYVVIRHGEIMAVAPGLRLVEATEQERARFLKGPEESEPLEYGLPV